MVIKFNELIDYDQFPQNGKHNYSDSQIVDLEFEVDGISYFIKTHIDVNYSRWIHPETSWCPREDECDLISCKITSIKGTKYHNETETETVLNDRELRKLQFNIENKIIFE